MDGTATLQPVVAAAILAALAFALRLAVHVRSRPGGVDTWYFLASADTLRATRRLPIRLSRYLLQDAPESYPPGFIVFLALIPGTWLRRGFWIVAPLVDTLHLLVLYAVALWLTGSLVVAAGAGLAYALTPQLVDETRSLSPRPLGALLVSLALLLLLGATDPSGPSSARAVGTALAVIVTAALFLTHASSSLAFGVAVLGLAMVSFDGRHVLVPVGAVALATAVAPGLFPRMLLNYAHAIGFWRRNLPYRGAHEIADSPLYETRSRTWASGRWHRGVLAPAVRLFGGNPFVLPLAVAAVTVDFSGHWSAGMLAWSVSVWTWAAVTTFVKPLRPVGPGFFYVKATVFPTAFLTAMAAQPGADAWGIVRPAIVLAAVCSVGGVAVFLRYIWTRRTQQTASTPADLAEIALTLTRLPGDGVLCLPATYCDYLAYHSGKSVVWGGHSGDLARFEELSPVIRRPLEDLIAEYGLSYVVLDLVFTDVMQLKLDARLGLVVRRGQFALYRVKNSGRAPSQDLPEVSVSS